MDVSFWHWYSVLIELNIGGALARPEGVHLDTLGVHFYIRGVQNQNRGVQLHESIYYSGTK